MDVLERPSMLPQRLTALRGRLRRLLVLHGTAILVASMAATVVALVLADYLLHFAGGLRAVLLVAMGLEALALLWRFLIRPLRAPLTNHFLAGRVESPYTANGACP